MGSIQIAGLISGAVGRGAANADNDVRRVQYLFNLLAPHGNKPDPEDGKVTSALLFKIDHFQRSTLGFPHPDGRIDPDGRTLFGLASRARLRLAARTDLVAFPHNARDPAKVNRACVATYLQQIGPEVAMMEIKKLVAQSPGSGGSTALADKDFAEAAATLGPKVSAAIVQAFADVESGGRSGFGPAGLPVIAYEGHIFRKYTDKKYDSTHPLLSYKYVKKAGPEWKNNNRDQATAWTTLKAALDLDHNAALMSCSWGMFQVMGFNATTSCGYRSVDDFVADMKRSARGQLDAFVAFCKAKRGMVRAMTEKDFATMATLYNGIDYSDYDKRIEKAFKKHGGS